MFSDLIIRYTKPLWISSVVGVYVGFVIVLSEKLDPVKSGVPEISEEALHIMLEAFVLSASVIFTLEPAQIVIFEPASAVANGSIFRITVSISSPVQGATLLPCNVNTMAPVSFAPLWYCGCKLFIPFKGVNVPVPFVVQ